MSEDKNERMPEPLPGFSTEDVQRAVEILAKMKAESVDAARAAGQQRVPGSEFDLATILQDHNRRLKVLEGMPGNVKYTPGWSAEVDDKLTVGIKRGIRSAGIVTCYYQHGNSAVIALVDTKDNKIPLTIHELRQHIGGCLEVLARVEAGNGHAE
jgi:hypothetical protein